MPKEKCAAAGILFLLSSICALLPGCTDPATLATLVAYEEIRKDQEPKTLSEILFIGFPVLSEPCEFSIGIVTSDDDGHIVHYEKTCGDLPPDYRLIVEAGDSSIPDVVARIEGPPVGTGTWESCFVATDNDGNKSPVGVLSLACLDEDD